MNQLDHDGIVPRRDTAIVAQPVPDVLVNMLRRLPALAPHPRGGGWLAGCSICHISRGVISIRKVGNTWRIESACGHSRVTDFEHLAPIRGEADIPPPSPPPPGPPAPPAPPAPSAPSAHPAPNGHRPDLPPKEGAVVTQVGARAKPDLPPKEGAVVTQVGRQVGQGGGGLGLVEVNAADLAAAPTPAIEYLPLLGAPGYIPRGWCTIIAGYPKVGKTELLARLCHEWGRLGERIIYLSEESQLVWSHRLNKLAGDWSHLQLVFALGARPELIVHRIATGGETVVVVDTIRNLLQLQDETDNSAVARALTPVVAAARRAGKTLILLHHVRKGGGEHGEAIAGAHAFLGIVDVALELHREQNLGENRRRIRGWGRLVPIEEAIYELRPDGAMVLLGRPQDVERGVVEERLLALFGDDDGQWRTRKDLLDGLDEPKPSMEQLRLALQHLVSTGALVRDPAEDRRGATYRYRLRAAPEALEAPETLEAPDGGNRAARHPEQPHLPRASSMVVTQVGGRPSQDPPAPGGSHTYLPPAPFKVVTQVDGHLLDEALKLGLTPLGLDGDEDDIVGDLPF